MHYYSAYGLTLGSALELPELYPSASRQADLSIRWGAIDWALPTPNPEWDYYEVHGDCVYLYWSVVGKFLVRGGQEILIDPLPDVAEAVLRLPLLGAVLAVALHQRQQLVLHASAVATQDGAVLFLGQSGQGKSTMAASLCQFGATLMSDDVAPIQIRPTEKPLLQPGFPQIKLWPDALSATTGDSAIAFRPVHPEVEKVIYPACQLFCTRALPVQRIYILTTGDTLAIQPLSPQIAMTQLLANSFVSMLLGKQFVQIPGAAQHLSHCATLVKQVPVYQLQRPRDLALLPDIARLIQTGAEADGLLSLASRE
jgi:hypothetical protein